MLLLGRCAPFGESGSAYGALSIAALAPDAAPSRRAACLCFAQKAPFLASLRSRRRSLRPLAFSPRLATLASSACARFASLASPLLALLRWVAFALRSAAVRRSARFGRLTIQRGCCVHQSFCSPTSHPVKISSCSSI